MMYNDEFSLRMVEKLILEPNVEVLRHRTSYINNWSTVDVFEVVHNKKFYLFHISEMTGKVIKKEKF
jgi:hypothetical protein